MRINKLAVLAAGVALLATAAPALAQKAPRYGSFGVDMTRGKKDVKPGDDFWSYVNGSWGETVEFDADRSTAGFTVKLADDAENAVRAILDDMAKNPGQFGAKGKQVGDYYAAWMDEAGIEKRGTAPLKPYLARIAAVKDLAGLQVLFATNGYASPANLGIIPNLADPTRYTAIASQGGLGMAREYYLLEGEKYDAYRKAYRAYIEQIQTLAGIPDAAAKADAILALETSIAKVQWDPVQNRDITKLNHPADRAEMEKVAPEFDWELMLKTAGLSQVPIVIMANDTALAASGKIMVATPLQTWKDWMAFRFVSDNAQYLPKAFDDAKFGFYSATLNDVKQQRARWKRGVQQINNALGEAVGEIYIARHFPADSRAKMGELIEDLRGAFEERLRANSWMDEATRTEALAKLAAFDPRIGSPTKFIDYGSIKVDRADPLGNAVRANQFAWDLQLERLPKPVDRGLWGMKPQTVNASYSPLSNQLTFPAAFLQPPFFDPNADAAVNYGAIGGVIGHEMGHGFDDLGSRFDAVGKLRNWWSESASKAYKERTGALGAQYDQYEPIPGVKVNGKLTMGENIGDLGGIEMAYAAYQRYQAKHGKAPVINGMTGEQRFFLAYAQAYQTKRREGFLRQMILTDPHSPDQYRVNGIVRNVDAWYDAFGVKPGDKLYLPPEQRVRIW
jgi:putative endopeptidase